MSTKLPVVNANELIKILQEKGFSFKTKRRPCDICKSEWHQSNSSIHGKKDSGKGLLKQIMKDAGITKEDFQ